MPQDRSLNFQVLVDASTRKAEQTIRNFAREMNRRITQAVEALPDIEIDARTTGADRRIAEIRKELQALGDKRVGVDIDASAAHQQLRRLQSELRELGSRSESIQVRADTSAAVAALGDLRRKAKASGADAGGFLAQGIHSGLIRHSPLIATAVGAVLVAGAPAAIAGAGVLFGGIATAAAAQSERVRGAYGELWEGIKDDSLADAAAVEAGLVALADDLGAAFQRLRPQLRDAFAEVPQQLDHVTDGVLRLAVNAMPGLVLATQRAAPVFAGLEELLARTGTGLGGMFAAISEGAGGSGAVLAELGRLMQQLLPVLGQILAVGAELGGTALPIILSALGGFLDTISAILRVIEPIAPQLGMISGALVTGATAWKIYTAAIGAATLATGTAAGASGALSRVLAPLFATVALGPPLWAALAGRIAEASDLADRNSGATAKQVAQRHEEEGILYKLIGTNFEWLRSADEGTRAEQRRSAAIAQTNFHLVAQSDAMAAAIGASLSYDQALLGITEAAQGVTAATAAQADAERALIDAQAAFGVGSAEAIAAQQALDSATAATSRSLLGLQQASLSAATAAGAHAAAQAAGLGPQAAAEARARAFTDSLLTQAATLNGPARDAVLSNIARLSETDLAYLNSIASAQGFSFEVRNTPDGKRIVFPVDHEGNEIRDLTALIHAVPPVKNVRINADGTYSFAGGPNRAISTGGILPDRLATGGILPGYSPGRDRHSFVSRTGGRLELSGGEAVMRPEWTRAVSPGYVNAANSAARRGGVQGVERFLERTAPRPGEGRRGDGNQFATGGIYPRDGHGFTGGIYGVTQKYGQRLADGGVYVYAPDAVRAADQDLTDRAARDLAKRIRESGGNALAWARTQHGKPYIWGAVGPRGYDCSGFLSAVANVGQRRAIHVRRGATGTFPWPGFRPGTGPGLSIGSVRGNPGHMAGTIAGVNVEANGSQGVVVGGRTGAYSGMFNTRGHLPFDRGGDWRPGTWGYNGSGRTEHVLRAPERAAFLDLVRTLNTRRDLPQHPARVGGDPAAFAATVARATGRAVEAALAGPAGADTIARATGRAVEAALSGPGLRLRIEDDGRNGVATIVRKQERAMRRL